MKRIFLAGLFCLFASNLFAETPENLIQKLSKHEAVTATFSCYYVYTMSTSVAVKDTFVEKGFLLKKGDRFIKRMLEPEQWVVPLNREDSDRYELLDVFTQSHRLKPFKKFILKETPTEYMVVGYNQGKKIECLMDKTTSRPTKMTIFLDDKPYITITYVYVVQNGTPLPKRAYFHFNLANNHDMDINIEYLGFYTGQIPPGRDLP
jgi:hypothetical protein